MKCVNAGWIEAGCTLIHGETTEMLDLSSSNGVRMIHYCCKGSNLERGSSES